jgi:hypothetical protein
VTVLRDMLLLILPSAAFVWEAVKDKPSIELLILYMALVAFPGLAGALALARNGAGGTEPPSPQPPPPLPPPRSQPSSSSSPQDT